MGRGGVQRASQSLLHQVFIMVSSKIKDIEDFGKVMEFAKKRFMEVGLGRYKYWVHLRNILKSDSPQIALQAVPAEVAWVCLFFGGYPF